MANGNGNGSLWRIVPLVLTVLLLIGGWLVTWGKTSAKLDSVKTEVVKNTASRDTTIGLSKDVEYIKEDIEEIKEFQKMQDKKLDRLLELNGG